MSLYQTLAYYHSTKKDFLRLVYPSFSDTLPFTLIDESYLVSPSLLSRPFPTELASDRVDAGTGSYKENSKGTLCSSQSLGSLPCRCSDVFTTFSACCLCFSPSQAFLTTTFSLHGRPITKAFCQLSIAKSTQ